MFRCRCVIERHCLWCDNGTDLVRYELLYRACKHHLGLGRNAFIDFFYHEFIFLLSFNYCHDILFYFIFILSKIWIFLLLFYYCYNIYIFIYYIYISIVYPIILFIFPIHYFLYCSIFHRGFPYYVTIFYWWNTSIF